MKIEFDHATSAALVHFDDEEIKQLIQDHVGPDHRVVFSSYGLCTDLKATVKDPHTGELRYGIRLFNVGLERIAPPEAPPLPKTL